MSGIALIPEVEDEGLGPEVLRLRLQGLTAAEIGRKLMLPKHQVLRALDAVLPTVDAAYRRRAIAESLVTVDKVISEHMTMVKDPESASIVIRGVCERRALLGITGSVDPVQLVTAAAPRESSTAVLERSLARLCAERPKLEGGDSG